MEAWDLDLGINIVLQFTCSIFRPFSISVSHQYTGDSIITMPVIDLEGLNEILFVSLFLPAIVLYGRKACFHV